MLTILILPSQSTKLTSVCPRSSPLLQQIFVASEEDRSIFLGRVAYKSCQQFVRTANPVSCVSVIVHDHFEHVRTTRVLRDLDLDPLSSRF